MRGCCSRSGCVASRWWMFYRFGGKSTTGVESAVRPSWRPPAGARRFGDHRRGAHRLRSRGGAHRLCSRGGAHRLGALRVRCPPALSPRPRCRPTCWALRPARRGLAGNRPACPSARRGVRVAVTWPGPYWPAGQGSPVISSVNWAVKVWPSALDLARGAESSPRAIWSPTFSISRMWVTRSTFSGVTPWIWVAWAPDSRPRPPRSRRRPEPVAAARPHPLQEPADVTSPRPDLIGTHGCSRTARYREGGG